MTRMAVDLKKELPDYSATSGRFDVVEVPPRRYLMVDGHGDPNTSPLYADALTAVYPVAYAVKFAARRELGLDHVVMPLEALWWADDPAVFTTRRDKALWSWTVMILVPEPVTAEIVETAIDDVRRKKAPARIDEVRLDALDEGTCVQTLHIGPYDAEGEVLAELHDRFLPEHGRRPRGRHHEIYLSDARRAAPATLRTILRQPIEPA